MAVRGVGECVDESVYVIHGVSQDVKVDYFPCTLHLTLSILVPGKADLHDSENRRLSRDSTLSLGTELGGEKALCVHR